MHRSFRTPFLLTLALACAAAGVARAATVADYPTLAEHKALAVAPAASGGVYGIAHGQAHDLAASQFALAQCEVRRAGVGEPCEVTRLNDEHITPGRVIRERAARSPHDLYLWRYRSASATVFLAGSIHVLKPSIYPLPAPLEAAFAASDHLVVEVDTNVPPAELTAQTLRFGVLPDGATLAGVLPPALHARLAERLAAYGLRISDLARAKPALVMNELVLARLTALGYRPEHGVEQHFRAKVGSRPVLELESLEAQLSLLLEQPMATQIQLLADTLDQEPKIEPLLADMLAAWLGGNDVRFLELFKQQAGDSELAAAFNRQLLDERNRGMAATIAGYLNGRGVYFILVGAAHLVGDAGIVALLDRQGIRGHRVRSDETLGPGTAVPARAATAGG